MPGKIKFICFYAAAGLMMIFLAWANWNLKQQLNKTVDSGNIMDYYNDLDDGKSHIIYVMNGGWNRRENPTVVSDYQNKIVLRTPIRYGYSFLGWYSDVHYRNQIKSLQVQPEENIILYARWSPRIDNTDNVLNYSYTSDHSQENIFWLKDCDFGFVEAIDIPGMPDTRESDFLNHYIFSESQCPQGICFTEDYVLISSYSEEADCLGELMVFDRETGVYLVTLGLDAESHLGGITYDGQNIWVCNSAENTIERISYDFIQLMATQNAGDVIDARDVVDIYPVENKPSCITYYGGRLWIATHKVYLNSEMVAYHYDNMANELTVLSEYKIPAKVQGVAFDEDGKVYLSTSYGRTASSYLMVYSSVVELSIEPNQPQYQIEMPPGSEEIDILDRTLYAVFESAGEKYLEGTDGHGTSLSPIDKILTISIDSIPAVEKN